MIRGVNYRRLAGGYVFEGMKLEDIAKLRRILMSQILVLNTASDITVVKNESLLNDFILNSRIGAILLKGPTNIEEDTNWSIFVRNDNEINQKVIYFRDIKLPPRISCVNPNTILTVLRVGKSLDVHGRITVSNNENRPGFTQCCFCKFTEIGDDIVLSIESYGQKDIETLFDEAFAIYQSGIEV